MSWLCWHKWTKWEKYENRYKYSPGIIAPSNLQGKYFDGLDVRQKRHCVKCGLNQDELIKELY